MTCRIKACKDTFLFKVKVVVSRPEYLKITQIPKEHNQLSYLLTKSGNLDFQSLMELSHLNKEENEVMQADKNRL